jgi:sporulation protein YlmC with PRC-barrel domain
MDEGPAIAYLVLDKGVPVLASDGEHVGTVHHVVAATDQDIFHGIVVQTPAGRRFGPAEQIDSLHERGVDLKIDSTAVQELGEPGGGAAEFHEDPGEMKGWGHWVHFLGLRGDWRRDR